MPDVAREQIKKGLHKITEPGNAGILNPTFFAPDPAFQYHPPVLHLVASYPLKDQYGIANTDPLCQAKEVNIEVKTSMSFAQRKALGNPVGCPDHTRILIGHVHVPKLRLGETIKIPVILRLPPEATPGQPGFYDWVWGILQGDVTDFGGGFGGQGAHPAEPWPK